MKELGVSGQEGISYYGSIIIFFLDIGIILVYLMLVFFVLNGRKGNVKKDYKIFGWSNLLNCNFIQCIEEIKGKISLEGVNQYLRCLLCI